MDALVTIVVPCRNERSHISRCLDSLLGNDYPRLEILVVDGLSRDGTREVLRSYAERYPSIQLLDNPKQITARALNIGIRQARGEYIMVAGAHASFPADYISGLMKYLEQLDAVGVGGSMVTHSDHTTIGHSIARVLSNRVGVGNSMFRLGTREPVSVDTVPFGIYHRDVFYRAGLYDERLVRNQDIEFSKRIIRKVGKLFLVPTIRCDYYFKGRYGLLARSNFQNGLWNIMAVYLTRKFRSISFRHIVPALSLLFILISLILGLFVDGGFLLILLLAGAGYLLLLFITAIRINDSQTSVPAIMWSFIVLHFSYGFGSLAGLLSLPFRRYSARYQRR